jgi:DNA (cytosine-5)-methyltransferase 1
MTLAEAPTFAPAPSPSVVDEAIAAARAAWEKGEREPFEFVVLDGFCGAGGSSTGMVRAIRRLNEEGFSCRSKLACVNHSARAIATHKANHGHADHYIEDMTAVDPKKVVPGRYVHLFMASPECVFFSRARGNKPVNDQRRMQPWSLIHWATEIFIRVFWVENVPEIVDWGPLCTLPDGHGGAHVHEDGPGREPTALRLGVKPCDRPDPKRKGETFQSWIAALRGLRYELEWKVINAADHGAATTRKRFFLQARKDGLPIRWPEPTHRDPRKPAGPWETRKPWRGAKEIIDWSVPGESILSRKKPLSVNTRCRMARGFELNTGEWAPFFIDLLELPEGAYESKGVQPGTGVEPFTCGNRTHSVPRSPAMPVATATAGNGGGNLFLTQPVITRYNRSTHAGSGIRSADEPLPTQTKKLGLGITQGQAQSVGAFQLNQRDGNGSGRATRSTDQPAYSPTTVSRTRLVSAQMTPFLLAQGGGGVARSSDLPAPTNVGGGATSLAVPQAHLVTYNGNGTALSTDRPLAAQTTKARFGLTEPRAFVVPKFGEAPGQSPRVHDLEDVLPTVTSEGAGRLVRPTATALSLDLDDAEQSQLADAMARMPKRFVWDVLTGVLYFLDILFRMLLPKELAASMGFNRDGEYLFTGTVTEQIEQIGNAVDTDVADALSYCIFRPMLEAELVRAYA